MKNVLKCPNCGLPLYKQSDCLRCERGHSFDTAKSGYTNLLLASQKVSADPSDNKTMIAARRNIMNLGYYKILFDDIAKRLTALFLNPPEVVVDSGCGEGYFAGRIQNLYPNSAVLGVDISKHAVDAAAKAQKRPQFLVASGKLLPILDGVADLAFCAFAPLFIEEIRRVLKQTDLLVYVCPSKTHLWSLKQKLYATPLPNDEITVDADGFQKIDDFEVSYDFFAQTPTQINDLISMTPYGYKTDFSQIEKVAALGELNVDLCFSVSIFKKL